MDYDRNSFDRFGDNLCEYILSYLPLNDCFEYECVSQQWKRLIFNKQNKLVIGESGGNRYCISKLSEVNDRNYNLWLECVLKKCAFISDLCFGCDEINDHILDTISNNCLHLKSFECYAQNNEVTKRSLDLFAAKCGQKLEILVIKGMSNLLKLLVNALPNVKRIRFIPSGYNLWYMGLNELSVSSLFITSDNKPVLPTLEQIDLSYLFNLNVFESFVDVYGKQIKKIGVEDFFAQLNRFECLEKLELNVCSDVSIEDESYFRLIGEKCVKLIDLRLHGYLGNLFNSFANNFVSLKKLQIHFQNNFDGGVEFFKSCAQLTHLSLHLQDLKDENFSEIDAYLPKLKYLQISSYENELTDKTLRGLAKLDQLYCLKIKNLETGEINKYISDNGICYLINNCASIRCIEIDVKTNVSQKSVNEFFEKAKKFPKIKFNFAVRFYKPKHVIVNDMPTNFCLEIIITQI